MDNEKGDMAKCKTMAKRLASNKLATGPAREIKAKSFWGFLNLRPQPEPV